MIKSKWSSRLYWLMTLCFWLVTFATWISIPESIILNAILLVIGLALIFIKLLWGEKNLKGMVNDFKVKSISTFVVSLILALSIWGILNYIFYKKQGRWEIISSRQLDLSDQTKVLIKGLDKTNIILLTKRERWPFFLPALKRAKQLNDKISLMAEDLDLKPSLIQKYNLEKVDALVIENDDKRVVTYFDKKKRVEEVFVNALLKFSQDNAKQIVFSQGHGEFSIYDDGNQGLSFLRKKLMEQNFIVTGVDLDKGAIGKDVSMLILWGVRRPLEVSSLDKIKQFLSRGGKLFVAQGPVFGIDHFEGVRKILRNWDIDLSNNIIIDKLSTVEGMEATITRVQNFNETHEVLKNFKEKAYLPLSSSLSVTQNFSDKKALLMAQSEAFPGVWGESNLVSITEGSAVFDNKSDTKGPLGVMASSEQMSVPYAGITVIGSSSFALNNYSAQTRHFQLLLNTISWQLGLNDLILKEREGLKRSPIILSQKHVYLIFYFAVLLLPLLALIGAIFFYLRKKRL